MKNLFKKCKRKAKQGQNNPYMLTTDFNTQFAGISTNKKPGKTLDFCLAI
jgi:hypothetical protein